MKSLAREIIPPALLRLARPLRKPSPAAYGYSGDYADFATALAACQTGGYAHPDIVEAASQQARALQERLRGGPGATLLDGRALQNLAASLMALASPSASARPVAVLDFGGGLGLHYQQLAPFLRARGAVSWTVCETEPMSARGTQSFATAALRFVSSLDEVAGRRFDLAIASGSLQYLDDPVATLRKLAAVSEHLLLNRLPLTSAERHRLTIHRVDPSIYAAAIPTWLLSERLWLATVEELGLEIVMRWEVPQDSVDLDGRPVAFQGMLLRRRTPGAVTSP